MPRELVVPDGRKWCPDCGEVLPLDGFPRSRAASNGRGSCCLACHDQRGRQSLAERGGSRTYHLARRYGISAEEADLMLGDQGGVCAVCQTMPAVHVDHETGAVRALLCFDCNGGLGQFRDDPVVLRAAADHVELHRAPEAGRTVTDEAPSVRRRRPRSAGGREVSPRGGPVDRDVPRVRDAGDRSVSTPGVSPKRSGVILRRR